jgi:activating signal cointegrator 1
MEQRTGGGEAMKALTILHPFAHLFLLPDSDPACKRVENRNWPTKFRGTLLIHAGLSETALDRFKMPMPQGMVYGAIIGTVEIYDCVPVSEILCGKPSHALRHHYHVFGPYCWLRRNPRRFETPIPCKGRLGLWDYRGELPETEQ